VAPVASALDGGPTVTGDQPSSPTGAPSEDGGSDAAAQESTTSLGSVVVTAERRTENIQTVPLAITAVSGDRIRDLDIRASSDIPRAVPNMSAATTEGRSRPRWFIRGIGQNDTSSNAVSPVGVYFDEVYENFALAQAFPLFDLERVEVLRGPQGTLWGKNTTGGAVSIISRKPSFETDGYGEATAGNYGELGVQGAGGGTLVSDHVAGRAAFFYESRNGYVTNVYNGKTQGDVRDAAGRLQLLVIPVDNLEINLNVHIRHNDGQSNAFYLAGPNGARTAIPGMSGFTEGSIKYTDENNGPDVDVDDQKGTIENVKYEAGPVAFTSISGYEHSSRLTGGDADYGPLSEQVTHVYAEAKQFTEEIRVAPSKPERFNWVVGGHYFWEALSSNTATGSLPGIPQPAAYGTFLDVTPFIQHTWTFAGFLHGSYDITKWFRFAAGARWTNETKSINLASYNTGARGAAVWNNVGEWWLPQSLQTHVYQVATQTTTRTWNAPTFDVSPSIDITPDLTTYFHYGHGFRGGTFNGGVTAQSNVSVVSPEYVDSYEIGVKSKLFDDHLHGSIAAFHYDYRNIQVLVNAATGAGATTTATVLQNAGSATGNGGEAELDALPVENLRVRGSVGLLDAWYGGFAAINNGMAVNASGNQLVRAPHGTAMLDASYRLPLFAETAVEVGSDWEYTAHQYFNAVDQQTQNLQQNGYFVGNVRLSYFTWHDKLELQGWIHNVANTEYKILGIAGAPGYNAIMFGPPRTVGVTVTGRF